MAGKCQRNEGHEAKNTVPKGAQRVVPCEEMSKWTPVPSPVLVQTSEEMKRGDEDLDRRWT
eukprot:gene5549-7208_t